MSLSERRRRILDSVPIAQVLGEYLPLEQSGTRFKALCPFHNDHASTLEIDPIGRVFHCRGCGASGDIVDFLCMYERLTIDQALYVLESRKAPDRPA